jgi:hypothetical protein
MGLACNDPVSMRDSLKAVLQAVAASNAGRRKAGSKIFVAIT